jgi:hypothetical protein
VSASFDFTDVTALLADMGDVPRHLHSNVRKAVQVSAQNVRDDMRATSRASSGRHARGYPASMDYDIERVGDGVIAEVGPNPSKAQGALGFLEEGVSSQGTSAQHAARLAAKANQDDFIRGILMAGTDAADV